MVRFPSPVEQLTNVRRWNEDRRWGIPDSELAALHLAPAVHPSPFLVDVLAVYLPGASAANGVQRTCEELWAVASRRQPRAWCWDDRKSGPKPVRLLDGVFHRPGVRRVTLDLAANWDRRDGARPIEVRSKVSAGPELLAAAAHCPEWIRSMDGTRVPFVCLAGYQVTVPDYETWRHVVFLSWSHFNRRINLSDNWADYHQDRFAAPVLVGAPVSVSRPFG